MARKRAATQGLSGKKGLFELAHKGTLFLDEINSMDFPIQAKILKVLEEKKYAGSAAARISTSM